MKIAALNMIHIINLPHYSGALWFREVLLYSVLGVRVVFLHAVVGRRGRECGELAGSK